MANNIDKKEPVTNCEQSKIDIIKCDNHELAGNIEPLIKVIRGQQVMLDKDLAMLYGAENGGYPPTQNGDIRSLFWLFSLMALQN